MTFVNAPLPVEIEQGAQGGPMFKTSIIELSSGHEQRNEEWSNTRAEWNVSIGIERKTDFMAVIAHFMARRGQSITWPFKDWSDYQAVEVLIGIGDGAEDTFQLLQEYLDTAVTYTRKITRPIITTLVISVDGTPLSDSDWTDLTLGRIQLDTAPAAAKEVTATFEFDNPVRYATDHLQLAVVWEQAASIPAIMIREVRE